MIDQPNEFTKIGLSPEINHPFESRMIVAPIPNLHKLNSPAKMVHHFLAPAVAESESLQP